MEYLFRKQVVTVRRKIRKLEHSDWFLTFVGGGIGAALRFYLESISFSVANLSLANILGCFFMGILIGLSVFKLIDNNWYKPLLQTGFLGGFTSFSALMAIASFGDGIFYSIGWAFALVLSGCGHFICGFILVFLFVHFKHGQKFSKK